MKIQIDICWKELRRSINRVSSYNISGKAINSDFDCAFMVA